MKFILKKIIRKLYHLISFLCLFFLFSTNVKALSTSSLTLNYNSLTTMGYRSATANNNRLSFDIQSNGNPVYIRQIYCFDAKVVTWSKNLSDSELKDVIFYNTNKTCNYYNSNYSGIVMYFYATYIPLNSPSATAVINFNASKNFSLGLLASGASETPYEYVFSDPSANVDVDINTSGIEQKQNQTNEKLDDIDDTLNDDSVDSSDDTLSDLQDDLPTNSVISDILLLPVRLLQAIINSLGGSCSSFNLGSLYGTNLVMPCIDIESYLGSAIWTFIDLVFSGMFIYVIRKKFIQIWENITNLKGGGNEID